MLVTKVGATSNSGGELPLRLAQKPTELRAEVETNLRSLGVERLDVVNLRRGDTGPGLIAEMVALRDEGDGYPDRPAPRLLRRRRGRRRRG